MHLTLRVSLLQIGLVMLLCLLVLVRNGNRCFFFFGMTFFINSYEIYVGARSCIGRKYTSFFFSFF